MIRKGYFLCLKQINILQNQKNVVYYDRRLFRHIFLSTNRKANILGTSRDIEAKFASLSYLTNISICCNFGQIQRWVGVMLNDPQVKGKKEGATKALKGGGGMMILKK